MADKDSKQTLAELKASEERYSQIVNLFPNAIFLHRDGKIIFMNPAGLKLFGASDPAQIVGQSLWDLYPPERHGIVRSRTQILERTKQAVPTIEHTVLRLDGTRLNVEATACMIDFEGAPAFFVTMRDITENKKTKMLLELQRTVSRSLIESTNLIEASKNVLEGICSNLKLDVGKIWAFDKKDQILRLVTSWSMEEDLDLETGKMHDQVTLAKGEGLAGLVLETGEPCWQENLDQDYKLAIAVPILNEKEMLGVIECTNHMAMPRDDITLQTLIGLGDQIGLFLKRKKYEKDLAYLSKHDPITGLSNRAFFEEILAYELNLVKNKDQILAVLFLDVDSFNVFNESLGHAGGDEILKAIANRLLTLEIASENLGRFGPQFAIMLSAINKVEDVTKFIKQLNHIMTDEFTIQEQKFTICFNYGIAMYPDDGEDVHHLMRSASIALSTAKEIGNGAVQFCTVDLNLRAQKRVKMENDLRGSLAKEELFLQYQPIVDANTLITSGFESLIRWVKDGKNISPAEFIPLAEKTHLIIPLGEWIMRTACMQCKEWNAANESKIFVSVNISPIQFNHSGVLDMLKAVLQDTHLEPACLKIEVTESALMDNANRSIKMLRTIKDLGIKISIDDFGTGYSSLNYLRHLPIDYLKIDQSFIRNMTINSNDAAIVKTIIDLAQNLNYKVIAEGVETQEQLNFLTTLGCYNIQGYYFSPPLQVVDATAFLQQGKLLR